MSEKQPSIHAFFGGKAPTPKDATQKVSEFFSKKGGPKAAEPSTSSKRALSASADNPDSPAKQASEGSALKRVKRRTDEEKTQAAQALQDTSDDDFFAELKQTKPKKSLPAANGATPDKHSESPGSKEQRQCNKQAAKSPAGPVEAQAQQKAIPASAAGDQAPAVAADAEQVAAAEDTDEEEVGEREEETEEEKVKVKPLKKAKGVGKACKPTVKMDGVGAGALAAAALHANFDLDALAKWPAGEAVPYEFIATTFDEICEETKRLAIIGMLCNAFRAVIAHTPEDLLPMVYLCISKVAPAHSGIELGIGDSILLRALAQGTGRQEAQVKKEYEEAGDLGVVACASKNKQRTMFQPKPLTVRGVFKALKEIASIEGSKSQDVKRGLIMKLLVAAKGAEPGYLVRSLQGKLRIGLAEQSVLVALAHAVCLQCPRDGAPLPAGDDLANHLEAGALAVRNAYSECPNYDLLVPALLAHGTAELLTHVHFTPGTPVKPMLARATNGVSEVLDKFADCEFTCEYKYDGERAQVHVLEDGSVQVYSRNLENTTSKYPDIVERMPGALAAGTRSVVLDCEAQAWDPERRVFLPFQVLTTRKRKDVRSEDVKVQIVLYAFDCLYLNGDVMLRRPLLERREALYNAIVPAEGKIQFATAKTSRDLEELQAFLEEAVNDCTEGLIVKTLADTYEPSKRSLNWLKLKKDYLEGCGDTFDVTVIGALHGKGKRTGCYGSFLLAIYNEEQEEYQTISKIGTGFSEEKLKELTEVLRAHVIPQPRKYYRYTDKLVPDVWFDAKVVWEVKAADLSISPVYTAAVGTVDANKGISIRFPRLVRDRDDKGPEDTTSPEQVAGMYNRQAFAKAAAKPAADDDVW